MFLHFLWVQEQKLKICYNTQTYTPKPTLCVQRTATNYETTINDENKELIIFCLKRDNQMAIKWRKIYSALISYNIQFKQHNVNSIDIFHTEVRASKVDKMNSSILIPFKFTLPNITTYFHCEHMVLLYGSLNIHWYNCNYAPSNIPLCKLQVYTMYIQTQSEHSKREMYK